MTDIVSMEPWSHVSFILLQACRCLITTPIPPGLHWCINSHDQDQSFLPRHSLPECYPQGPHHDKLLRCVGKFSRHSNPRFPQGCCGHRLANSPLNNSIPFTQHEAQNHQLDGLLRKEALLCLGGEGQKVWFILSGRGLHIFEVKR